MTEAKRGTLAGIFARKKRDIQNQQDSPEERAAWESLEAKIAKSLDERIAENKRLLSIVTAGEEAAAAGKSAVECPHPTGSREALLWLYGLKHPKLRADDPEDDLR